jgi:hypothetical protein
VALQTDLRLETVGVASRWGVQSSIYYNLPNERAKVAVMTATTTQPITLLNASYEVLDANYATNKAARLLALGKAIVQESVPDRFLGQWEYPRVLRLTHWVRVAQNRIYGPPRVSKRLVLIRDKHTCAFCGREGHTIDHIHPRSRGGQNTWQNLVTACTNCNHKKGSRTPKEAGMKLLWEPYVPTKAELYPA